MTKIKKIDRNRPIPKTLYDIQVSHPKSAYLLEGGIINHNSGLKYASSTIIHLSKKKDRDGKDVIGVIIHCKTQKSRLTKENQMIDVQLNYTTGLNRYYGLVEIAVEAEIFKKISTKIELPDGTTRFANAINKDPKKYFTQDVLDQIETFVKTKFCYGTSIEDAEKELEDELTNE